MLSLFLEMTKRIPATIIYERSDKGAPLMLITMQNERVPAPMISEVLALTGSTPNKE